MLEKYMNNMKKILFAAAAAALLIACNRDMENPLLTGSGAPYGAPAFDKIKTEHYKPAFEAAIAEARAEVAAIYDNAEPPTFENTIEALHNAGRKLTDVSSIFFNLNEACTSPEMQKVAEDVTPLLTEYEMSVILNQKLFDRIRAVYEARESLNLDIEQAKLLEVTYRSFANNGAALAESDKEEFAKIQEKLSLATLKFGKNVLDATNAYTLTVTDPADLAGLPEYVRTMAAEEAASRNVEGWVFTLQAPLYSPFMKFSENRELREKLWRAYNSRCIGGEFGNVPVIREIIELRMASAALLGYDTYAEYALEERMAKNAAEVNTFLGDLRKKVNPFAMKDVAQVREFAASKGFEGDMMPWDYSFWSEKLQKERYEIDEELLKPYFELTKVQDAIFSLAGRLYGLEFTPNAEIPVYHPDVKVYEVKDASGRFMSLLYLDFFPRESKRGGAWMTSFREEGFTGGVEERPFVSLVTNFTKPTATEPSLLTFYEVTTFLHEFGHALHGILAEGRYSSLTGTNVARDFVELPSQIMENWAYEPEYLNTFARHYKTGELIPSKYIDLLVAARNFNEGYAFVRQLNYAEVDMAWHTLKELPSQDSDLLGVEDGVTARSPMFPSVPGTAFSPAFTHIFSGGYAAGYYSYKWAEVLEADAFSVFKKNGIFDRATAESFRDKILSRGRIVDADVLFRDFKGGEPDADALLRKCGMVK